MSALKDKSNSNGNCRRRRRSPPTDNNKDRFALFIDHLQRRLRLESVANGLSSDHVLLHTLKDDEVSKMGVAVDDRTQDWSEDNYIYCEMCKIYYVTSCRFHPIFWVVDRKVTETSSNRAKRTLPAFLTIKRSSIPDAGEGVFANVDIPTGLVFGPYQGVQVNDAAAADNGYSWEIRHCDGASIYLDAHDVQLSNWMRYINSPRWEAEQNLIALQYNGSIYYRVIKPIDTNQELLVWYGHQYGKSLGVFSIQPPKRMTYKHPFILS